MPPVLARDQHIEVADGLAAAAIAPGHDHLSAVSKTLDERLGLGFGNGQFETLLSARLLQRIDELLFDRGPKSTDLPQAAGFDGALEIGERADVQLVVQQLNSFGTKTRQGGHLAQLAGQLTFQGFEQPEPSGVDNVADLAGEVLADSGKLGQVAAGRQ